LDTRDAPILRELGWSEGAAKLEERVTKTWETLIKPSLIGAEGKVLQVTEKGRAELGEEM
jgi:hypothetical protein